jgi:hypothetical protein
MLYQNPAIRSRVKLYLVEQAKGGPSKLLLSFFFSGTGQLSEGFATSSSYGHSFSMMHQT